MKRLFDTFGRRANRGEHRDPARPFPSPGRKTSRSFLTCVVYMLITDPLPAQPTSTLIIEIDGDMLAYGGVVTVYPIPAPAGVPAESSGDGKPLRLTARYAQVQMRYPSGGDYAFDIRPVERGPDVAAFKTQLLSVIGDDGEGHSARMQVGFVGAYASGGQIVRIPSRNEWGGPDEATRSAARWGKTQVYADPPPADNRSARALVGVLDDPMRPVALQCTGDARATACTVAADRWPAVEALWWRAIAEQRLERLDFYALRRCYDARWFHSKTCKDDPDADEPSYR